MNFEAMPVFRFPDPRSASPEGIVAVGGDLHPESLLVAYRQGIFPWPVEGFPMLWFCPEKRAVLDFGELHVPRSLARARKRCTLEFTIDRAFPEVIRACAETPRRGQVGTWITPEVIEAYTRLHRLGFAHSAEAWRGDRLVAGLYGVDVDGAFSAESMFHRESNASKLVLLFLVDYLKSRGLDWIDIQVITPHLRLLGAKEIDRDSFLERLRRTRARGLRLFPSSPSESRTASGSFPVEGMRD
ncbi:MAG: leucyl/phenylalanyl-tRNA--protein transferase [Candidatus Binatia bacterium]|nr:MAG: leucyl/phenylalanyl-tRNA--protein transferase [Candidatus Binatia bacterium]